MDLAVDGRHALLFDDDSTAAFVDSRDALVPWMGGGGNGNGDATLLIDRYDVRHLLDRIPARPSRRHHFQESTGDGTAKAELDRERYLDLPSPEEEPDYGGDDTKETSSGTAKGLDANYQAVSFSYGNAENLTGVEKTDSGSSFSGYRPPFPIPQSLMNNLPSTEKLHQIIARTALFVSKHGGQSEIVLRVKQGDNPTFGFLMPDHHLHVYYRFLVENHDLLDVNKSHEAKRVEHKGDESSIPAGALSLLGSVYGDDDDDIHQVENDGIKVKNSGDTTDSAVPQRVEQCESSGHKTVEVKKETKMAALVASSKEKTISIKKNPCVNSALLSAPNKKLRDDKSEVQNVMERPQKSQIIKGDAKALILEPPSHLKQTIDKIVELIMRNGKEFEAILIEQDKGTGRLPFLLPSNQYHPYYCKILQDACEGNTESKRKIHGSVSRRFSSDKKSSEVSEEWLFDVERKEKFKMVLGSSRKESNNQCPVPFRQSGASADEAAAIVLAATRGSNPALGGGSGKESHDNHQRPARQTGATADEAAAIVLAATRGSSPANVYRHASSNESVPDHHHVKTFHGVHTGSSTLQGHSVSGNQEGSLHSSCLQPGKGSDKIDDIWIAKAIAKSAAAAASSEADSSEASLTKEQKLKAERLKRAKLFAAMIKSGQPISKLTNSTSVLNLPQEVSGGVTGRSGSESDGEMKEREGSSVPFRIKTDKVDLVNDVETRHKGEKSRRRHHSHSRESDHEEVGEDQDRRRKRHRSEHSGSHSRAEHKHKRSRSSKDEKSSHHHKHHSSDEEDRPRRSSRSRRNHHSGGNDASEDEDRERRPSHKHHHHSRSERTQTRGSEREKLQLATTSLHKEEPQQASDNQPTSTDVPSDLRAKIRAMLLETM